LLWLNQAAQLRDNLALAHRAQARPERQLVQLARCRQQVRAQQPEQRQVIRPEQQRANRVRRSKRAVLIRNQAQAQAAHLLVETQRAQDQECKRKPAPLTFQTPKKTHIKGSHGGVKMTAALKAPKPTKKEQIVAMFREGQHDLRALSDATYSRLSYVASVLQSEGLIEGYYDLYNEAPSPMNAYSESFRNKLGFKDEPTAVQSVRLLHDSYLEYEALGDRAGQHHVLMLAMKMFNRARWSNKTEEAEIFKRWLVRALDH
jgi:hypothetical protein